MILHGMNPDIHPPSASSPICGDCVQGVCEVGEGVEGKFGEVDGGDILGCFGVSPVELRHESPHTFDIFRQSPFILFYAVSFPTYEVLEFPSEDSAVYDAFHLVFLNSVADDR